MAGNFERKGTKQPMECEHDTDGRHLFVSIDGTSNQFGRKNTNVIELYSLLHKEERYNQLSWYNSGIGTYAPPSFKSISHLKQVLHHKVDLAIAWDFEKTVLGAYRWLSDNYQPGDTIYLFGFSRGAFQVRVLSAMIHKVGLIYKGNELQIPFAYALYADPKSDEPILDEDGEMKPKPPIFERFKNLFTRKDDQESPSDSGERISMAQRFKNTFSREGVKVHFVGAWDTVSSIGVARGQKLLPYTVDGMKHVCYFRHALALDERRVKFLPEFAYGGRGIPPETDNISPGEVVEKAASTQKRPQVKEVWFAGTHSDIGGGNVQNVGMNRSRPPLRWMVLEAESVGLRTKGFSSELPSKDFIEIRESLTKTWWPFELLPIKRLTFSRKRDGDKTTRRPHLGRGRKIHLGQKIHSSVVLGDPKKEYTPRAHLPNHSPGAWKELSTDWLELDIDEFVKKTVDDFVVSGNKTTLRPLQKLGTAGPVPQALYDKVVEVLENTQHENNSVKYQLLIFITDFLTPSALQRHPLKLEKWKRMRGPLAQMAQNGADSNGHLIQEFVERFTACPPPMLKGHTEPISSVAFSPDGRYLASGSWDRTIRLWDTQAWQAVGQPFRGHMGIILSIAFSPDGKHIVSGSHDNTIRVWDVEMGKAVGKPLEDHTGPVSSVAYSPDGKFIASGSWDRTVRLWDSEKGEAVGKPLEGQEGAVRTVAFSLDGKLIASGLDDGTIWLWNTETHEPVGVPCTGHTSWVNSIAFSPDMKHIISSSDDKTLRLWVVQTGKEDRQPFEDHTDLVWSVAFSPDGRRVVSGSEDETVRLWNVMKRDMEGPAAAVLTGHTNSVLSVAFSTDGWCVASGSRDGTIRIWDVGD